MCKAFRASFRRGSKLCSSLSLLLSFSLVALRVLLFLNLYRSRAATAAARVFAHIRFRVAIAGRIIIRTQVRFFLASVWYTFTSRSPLPPRPSLPFAFVEETSPSATTFSAWQTRSARACCDFYSLAFYFCFSSSSPTVLSRSSPPPLSPLLFAFSIYTQSFLSLSFCLCLCLSSIVCRTRNAN